MQRSRASEALRCSVGNRDAAQGERYHLYVGHRAAVVEGDDVYLAQRAQALCAHTCHHVRAGLPFEQEALEEADLGCNRAGAILDARSCRHQFSLRPEVRDDQQIGKPRLVSCAHDVKHPLLHGLHHQLLKDLHRLLGQHCRYGNQVDPRQASEALWAELLRESATPFVKLEQVAVVRRVFVRGQPHDRPAKGAQGSALLEAREDAQERQVTLPPRDETLVSLQDAYELGGGSTTEHQQMEK